MLSANRRGMLFLYLLLGCIIFLVVASGAVIAPIAALLIAAYLGFVGLSSGAWVLNSANKPSRKALKSAPLRISRAAQLASENAPPRSNLTPLPYALQDIGIIIDERRPDGIALRRARYISQEDESIRPYIVVHLPPEYPSHPVVIRFQIEDAAGEPQFIYDMPYKLRAGENLIVPDYRLPLKGSSKLMTAGTWDVEIRIDEQVMAVHAFSLMAPLAERLRQSGDDGEVNRRLMLDEEEEMPLSLEQLLRGR